MMRLCFGTLGRVLRECKLEQGVSDIVLIGELTRTIDPKCEYKDSDGTAVSKLLSCDQNLSNGSARRVGQRKKTDHSDFEEGLLTNRLSNVIAEAQTADRNVIAAKIAENVLPLFDEDRKQLIVPALFDLISSDTVIETDKSASFEKYVGKKKSQLLAQRKNIVLPELLAGLLLYTVVAVMNNVGRDCAKKIDRAYVDRFKLSAADYDVKYEMQTRKVEEESVPDEEAIARYLEKLELKYNKVYTLINKNEPIPFYSIFVCNNFSRQAKGKSDDDLIPNVTAEDLAEISKYIIVTGTGGIGKSMMMRHLLFDAIARYPETGKLPIFILLKDFDDNDGTMLDYVSGLVTNYATGITRGMLVSMLEAGNCLLIFDGLDEISLKENNRFTKLLETFVDSYTDNQFIISTRPNKRIAPYLRFVPLYIQPFTKHQALALIDKISFRPDDESIKARFRDELNQRLFWKHKDFAENPLLLTIMLLTYEKFEDIPSKMHVFYRKAYEALAQEHDANKGFNRPLATELSADDFAAYLSEFCALSYCNEDFKLTKAQIYDYFNRLNIRKRRNDPKATAENFLYDLCNNLCMMYLENDIYRFTHRSFQEYFCARCFSNQLDDDLVEIGNIFENMRSRSYADKTFPMLYDMIPTQINTHMFAPFLKRLISECNDGNGYWTFLSIMYPYIEYERGEVDENHENPPGSYLYEFIRNEFFYEEYDFSSLPFERSFIIDSFVYLEDGKNTDKLVSVSDIPAGYEEAYGRPEEVGWRLELDIDKVKGRKARYAEVVKAVEDEGFCLKREYRNMEDCYHKLLESPKKSGHSILERLI